jgi:hypothetical protein
MNGNGASSTGLGDVRNLLGFLVAGFAGVLNVLGLKSAEIGVVLRNDPVQVGIVAGFLLVAVLTAVVSVFVSADRHPISVTVAVIVLLFAVATFPLMVWLIPPPFQGHHNEHVGSVIVTWSLLGAAALMTLIYATWCLARWVTHRRPATVAAAHTTQPAPGIRPTAPLPPAGAQTVSAASGNQGCLWWRRRAAPTQTVSAATENQPVAGPPAAAAATGRERPSRKYGDLLNLQCLLLAVAVILTSTAAYGAMRVETNSQTSSVAQIGDTLQVSGQRATLAVAVSASKLTMADWLSVNVLAVPSSWKLSKLCHSTAATRLRTKYSVQCVQDPCFYAANVDRHAHCKELSEDVLAPDSAGSVLRTIDVLFAARRFQHVQVTAQTCRPRVGKPQGRCQRTGAVSRLEIAVPGRRAR